MKFEKKKERKIMSLLSPPKHLCTPRYKGYSVLQSGSSVTQKEIILSFLCKKVEKICSKPDSHNLLALKSVKPLLSIPCCIYRKPNFRGYLSQNYMPLTAFCKHNKFHKQITSTFKV